MITNNPWCLFHSYPACILCVRVTSSLMSSLFWSIDPMYLNFRILRYGISHFYFQVIFILSQDKISTYTMSYSYASKNPLFPKFVSKFKFNCFPLFLTQLNHLQKNKMQLRIIFSMSLISKSRLNKKGLEIEPWCNHFLIGKPLVSPLEVLTIIFTPS